MNLKYRILWFEDDEEVVEDRAKPILESFLLDLGLELQIEHHLNGSDLETLIKKNFDLIITDLNLGEEDTGEKIIDNIRKGKILTEVLLYSASQPDLEKVINRKGLIERASFTVGIGNLLTKLKDIINLTVKKHQDVNNTRGLVIAETILLEKKIEKILVEYFNVAKDSILPKEKLEILESFKARKQELFKEELEVFSKIDFSDIKTLIEKDILTASNSVDVINSILKSHLKELNIRLNSGGIDIMTKQELTKKKTEVELLKTDILNFRKEILEIRNTLAHVEEEEGEDGVPILCSLNKSGTKIKFDPTQYIKIRRDLQRHNLNLTNISNHIQNLS